MATTEYCLECGQRVFYCYYIQSSGPYCFDCYKDKCEEEYHINYTYAQIDADNKLDDDGHVL